MGLKVYEEGGLDVVEGVVVAADGSVEIVVREVDDVVEVVVAEVVDSEGVDWV